MWESSSPTVAYRKRNKQIRRKLASCFVLWDHADTVVRLNNP